MEDRGGHNTRIYLIL